MASVGKRPNGSWEVRYKEGTAHRSKSFKLKRDADKYRLKVETEIEGGIHVAASQSVTVPEAVEQYIAHIEARHREQRRMGYAQLHCLRIYLRKHVSPYFGSKLLIDLRYADLDDWVKKISLSGKLAPATVTKTIRMLKAVIDYAVKRQQVKINVAVEALKDRRGIKRAVIRTFDKHEVRDLIAACSVRPPHFSERLRAMRECMVHLAAFCGLRFGEIMGLTVENVDLDARLVRVRHSLTAWDEHKGPKTHAGIRDVPMPLALVTLLRTWMAMHYIENDRRLIFRVRNGNMLAPANFYSRYWQQLLGHAGLDAPDSEGRTFHFHALRHFAASLMIAHGIPLTDVAALLGHSAFDVTLQVYAHRITRGNLRHMELEGMANSMLQPVPPPAVAGSVTQILRIPA